MRDTVAEETIAVPAEWAPQRAIWTAWPADPEQWNRDLEVPRRDVAALVRALAPNNRVRLLVNGAETEESARASLGSAAEIVPAKYGDVWLRDTSPIFAQSREGIVALRFKFNGWGGKFDLPGDDSVGDDMARLARTPMQKFGFVLEGGAIEHDGEGTVLATREVLLNANRNRWTEDQAEDALRHTLGAEKIIWLDAGLKNDHTDGHIDNVARFVAPGRVVCQSRFGADDPNSETLDAVAQVLEHATDARGRKLLAARIPSPGLVLDGAGEAAPASHMNFVIANGVVVVPVYETPSADAAIDALQALFRDRKVVGVSSRGLLGIGDAGGGSFHCITREEPA
jgi:agmatine deiminase